MKMKTAEEFKIYRGLGVGEVPSPNHLLTVNRVGSCLHAAFNFVILIRKLKLYMFFATLCPLHQFHEQK